MFSKEHRKRQMNSDLTPGSYCHMPVSVTRPTVEMAKKHRAASHQEYNMAFLDRCL